MACTIHLKYYEILQFKFEFGQEIEENGKTGQL